MLGKKSRRFTDSVLYVNNFLIYSAGKVTTKYVRQMTQRARPPINASNVPARAHDYMLTATCGRPRHPWTIPTQGAESQRSPFLGVPFYLWVYTPFVAERPNLTRYNSWDGACFSEWASPTPRGCTAPSLPNFGGFLFICVHVPSVASAKNDVRVTCGEGRVSWGQPCLPPRERSRAVLTCFGALGPPSWWGLSISLSLPSLPSPLPSPTLSSPPLRSRPLKSS